MKKNCTLLHCDSSRVCRECVEHVLADKEPKCPVCRANFHSGSLKPQHSLVIRMSQTHIPCFGCNGKVSCWLYYCKQFSLTKKWNNNETNSEIWSNTTENIATEVSFPRLSFIFKYHFVWIIFLQSKTLSNIFEDHIEEYFSLEIELKLVAVFKVIQAIWTLLKVNGENILAFVQLSQ